MSNIKSEFEKYFKENHAESFYSVDAALEMRGDDYIDFHAADLWALWQHQQSKIDELTLQVAEMKSRLNDAYTDGQSAMYAARQSKVDGLQKKNTWLSDVAERENKRANKLQEENVNTTVLLGKTIQERNELQKQRDSFIKAYDIEMGKNIELQKRVDASLIAFENLKEEINQLHGQCDLHLIKYLEEKSQVLEQALKGGSDE